MRRRCAPAIWPAALRWAVICVALASGCLSPLQEAAPDGGGAGGNRPDAAAASLDQSSPGNRDSGPTRGPINEVMPETTGAGGALVVAGTGGAPGTGGASVSNGWGGAPGTGGAVVLGPWVATGAGVNPPVGAFPAGQENATTFYACRAMHAGGVHGGKAFPRGNCNFGYGGAEISVAAYDLLVGALFAWQPVTGPLAASPIWAVPSGREASGISQYVCRASYQGGIHPGKLLNGMCGIGYGGAEVGLSAFEILLRPMEGESGSPFDRTHWKVTASSSDARSPPQGALDGDPISRWSSGRVQQGNEWFRVDLGVVAAMKRLVLDTSRYPGDFPVNYDLALSADGVSYVSVASGSGATVTNISFAPASGRYVRITQTGQAASQWWSIADLTIGDQ